MQLFFIIFYIFFYVSFIGKHPLQACCTTDAKNRQNPAVWGVSTAVSVIVPLLWTGICLPLTYWFGFHSAQTMGLIAVIPVFYFIKYFEDGAGFSAMTDSIFSYAVVVGVAAAVLFMISMIISMAGYSKKK